MTKAVSSKINLKEKLDEIDQETVLRGEDKLASLFVTEKLGMWRKGAAVIEQYPELGDGKPRLGGRGAAEVSFANLSRETGRDDKAIARWTKLYLAHPDEEAFLIWVDKEAEKAVTKWKVGMSPAPQIEYATPIPPKGQFSVILADPPWRYDFSPTDSRKIENQYPTMELEDICTLPESVPLEFADNAVLFLWATAPKLQEAFTVLQTWGFSYVTHGVWDKEVIGMGYWFRGQHEPLLIATRGSFPPPPEPIRIASIIRSHRAKHSEKPEAVYAYIEAAYPDHPKLDVFAREERPGWVTYGNQVTKAVSNG